MNKQSKWRLMLIVIFVSGGLLLVNKTQAWLLAKTDERANQFTVGKVTHEIEEKFDKNLKTDVKITNTGNTTAFVRVKIIPQWLDKTGNNSVGLVATDTYDIVFNEVNWFEKDGFWYCRQPVMSGEQTAVLVKSAKPKEQLAEAYQEKLFNLEVITQSVQSSPIEAVMELWGVDPSN
ncbi:hypothetical protein I6N95_11130 [Vagococcus sp. BWB3-3]|uniref:Uncharacterized protein n=1 Tax=Vagococcus allomyrinae TaxID=2794353 RepID=A0A940PAR3_9ENTE|nr:hypothetical protein [Vagococcus allomyrinae]MBP1041559.1 hypothetical protein [Vagococcus allomyrinae]